MLAIATTEQVTYRLPTGPTRSVVWRRALLAATAAAIVVILALLPALLTGGEQPVATTVATTVAPTVTTTEALEEIGFLDTPLFEQVPPGRYVVSAIGTAFEIDITGEWWLQRNSSGHVVFTHPDSTGPGDRDVAFFRPTALVDPVRPGSADMSWPLDDLQGWLEDLDPEVVRTQPVADSLGGLPATRFDLDPGFALDLMVSGDQVAFLPQGVRQRVWWIDQGDLEPIVVLAGVGSEGETWFETADTILSTVRFGEPEPHPLAAELRPWEQGLAATLATGTIRLPAVGGIEFTIDGVYQARGVSAGGSTAIDLDAAREVGIFIAAETAAGEPINTIDDVVDAVESVATVTNQADTVVADRPARVIDVSDGPVTDVTVLWVGTVPLEFDEWTPPASGRMWIVDTDRGVLVISAGTISEFVPADEAIALAEQIVASLRLIDGPALGLVVPGS